MAHTTNPIILAVDTSSVQASYAILAGERELACLVTTADTPHSHTFFGNIERLLQQGNVKPRDLTALVAVTGPGSFTGLRVALAAVQGFAQTLQIPAWGLTTLDAFALAANVTGRVLVLLEAGRGECYFGSREIAVDGSFTQPRPDAVGQLETVLPQFIEDGLCLTGNPAPCEFAAQQYATVHLNGMGNPALASVIAAYVARAQSRGVTPEKHPLQACYIRPPDAKLKTNA